MPLRSKDETTICPQGKRPDSTANDQKKDTFPCQMEDNSDCDTVRQVHGISLCNEIHFVYCQEKKTLVKVAKTTESPNNFEKNTEIAAFSVITPGHGANFMKPADAAITKLFLKLIRT